MIRSRRVNLSFIYICAIKIKMDRRKQLEKNEIEQILLLRSQNQTIMKIAKILNKSYHIVYNFLKNSKIYRKKNIDRSHATEQNATNRPYA